MMKRTLVSPKYPAWVARHLDVCESLGIRKLQRTRRIRKREQAVLPRVLRGTRFQRVPRYRQLSCPDRTHCRYEPLPTCYSQAIGTRYWSRHLKDYKLGGDSMTQPIFSHAGEPRSWCSSKPRYFEARVGLRVVLIRLDTRWRGVIRSLGITDEGGVAIPLVIERTKRGCCAIAQRFCGCHRSSATKMLRQLWRSDPKLDMKMSNLKRQGFVQGGGRALEPCKSL